MLTITDHKVIMLGVPLDQAFELAFGKLYTLPRVLIVLTGTDGTTSYTGVGEAAIDFPFVSYDMWDVYYLLRGLDLRGRKFGSTASALPPLIISHEEEEQLHCFPAALTAITMANDDLYARAHGWSLSSWAVRQCGQPMMSIGFGNDDDTINQVLAVLSTGRIPKIKLGRGIEHDARLINRIVNHPVVANQPNVLMSADFNAEYSLTETTSLLRLLNQTDLSAFTTLEQPLSATISVEEATEFSRLIARHLGWHGRLIADESVTTVNDAIHFVQAGWSINYKLQKIGGFREAIRIALATNQVPGMVGGTFPTGIGRAYDLWAVASLGCASLPSDAWQPSSDWFSDRKHLIKQAFLVNQANQTCIFDGLGFGIDIDWPLVEPFIISHPDSEYRSIRQGLPSEMIHVDISSARTYSDLYRELTCREPLWNL